MKTFAQKNKDKLWVHHKGKIHAISLKKSSSHSATADAANDLIAPFSCKVLKIHVKKSQEVKKGDPIIVVEAMKMEYSYDSPRDGLIEDILVSVGAIVQEGTQFVRWKDSK